MCLVRSLLRHRCAGVSRERRDRRPRGAHNLRRRHWTKSPRNAETGTLAVSRPLRPAALPLPAGHGAPAGRRVARKDKGWSRGARARRRRDCDKQTLLFICTEWARQNSTLSPQSPRRHSTSGSAPEPAGARPPPHILAHRRAARTGRPLLHQGPLNCQLAGGHGGRRGQLVRAPMGGTVHDAHVDAPVLARINARRHQRGNP